MPEPAQQVLLVTARLLLKPVDIGYLDDIHELLSLPETDRYNTAGIPTNTEETRSRLNNWLAEQAGGGLFPYVIELKDTGIMLGLISLRFGKPAYKIGEISYKIHPAHWGLGYATEAVEAVIDLGFGVLDLHRIEAGCAVDNAASARVLEKVGMQREARRRQLLPLQTGWSDNFEYAILESDKRGLHKS